VKDIFTNYPKKIKASTQREDDVYVLQSDVYAVQGHVPPTCKPAIIATIEEGKTVVCQGNPDDLPSSVDRNTITPVYALEPNGPFAVPTGLILVRFADHIRAVNQKAAFQHIGYILDQELAYAPQALWIKAANADIAFALNHIAMLEMQPDIENIEAQMLMASIQRKL
jgi:hypothetical protein